MDIYYSDNDLPHDNPDRITHFTRDLRTIPDDQLIGMILHGDPVTRSSTATSLLQRTAGCLHRLCSLTTWDLAQIPGISNFNVTVLSAAIELGRRKCTLSPLPGTLVTSSEASYELFRPVLSDLECEEIWMLLLDASSNLITRERVSIGGLSETVGDPRAIFKTALLRGAVRLIIAHNHPNGQALPSPCDRSWTMNIVACGSLLGITVSDHLIIAGSEYFSFMDKGLITA